MNLPIVAAYILFLQNQPLHTEFDYNSNRCSPLDLNKHTSHQDIQGLLLNFTMTEELINEVKQWTLDDLVDSNPDPSLSKKDKAIRWGRPGHLTPEEGEIYVSSYSYEKEGGNT